MTVTARLLLGDDGSLLVRVRNTRKITGAVCSEHGNFGPFHTWKAAHACLAQAVDGFGMLVTKYHTTHMKIDGRTIYVASLSPKVRPSAATPSRGSR